MMNRRGFLSSLAAIAAGATLDPERLLWRPGAKLISIPKPIQLPRYTMNPGRCYGKSFALVACMRPGDVVSFGSDPKLWIVTEREFTSINVRPAKPSDLASPNAGRILIWGESAKRLFRGIEGAPQR